MAHLGVQQDSLVLYHTIKFDFPVFYPLLIDKNCAAQFFNEIILSDPSICMKKIFKTKIARRQNLNMQFGKVLVSP